MRNQPEVVVITATFASSSLPTDDVPVSSVSTEVVPTVILSQVPETIPSLPTANPQRQQKIFVTEHIVLSGDTLASIADQYDASLQTLIEINDLENPNILSVGQVIQLPSIPTEETVSFKIIPDSRLVRGPGSQLFDISAFVAQQPGFVRTATDTVETRLADGSISEQVLQSDQIIERVSTEYSVDARLLLALLEYRANWLSSDNLNEEAETHPLISIANSTGFDRGGLYNQLSWTANELNRGYYDWKYRGVSILSFSDGTRLQYASGLNAGTIALQYLLSQFATVDAWKEDVGQEGFFSLYYAYFGDPFNNSIDPMIPPDLQQPPLALPFLPRNEWIFTGGSHGGWGSGSAWAALDFAPPDDRDNLDSFCYISENPVVAIMPGVIARNSNGVVVLDLDGDGDDATGWSILYLHVTADPALIPGTQVFLDDSIGYPSCAGGVSTATHLHIARRYNGEWIPADCPECPQEQISPRFIMAGWQAVGLEGQVYQGYLQKDGIQVVAEQGRETQINRISR